MTIVQRIKNWQANGCIYVEGVEIYRRIGGSYPLSYFTKYCEAPFVPKRIEENLHRFILNYDHERVSDHILVEPKGDMPQLRRAPSFVTPNAIPSQIIELKEKARGLHKRHSHLHAQLSVLSTDRERYLVAEDIMESVIPDLDGIYDKIRHWQATGSLPPGASTNQAVLKTVKKMERRASLKSRLSRINGLLKKDLSDEDQSKYEKEKLDKEIELRQIENELGIQ